MRLGQVASLAWTLWQIISDARATEPGGSVTIPAIRTKVGRQYWEFARHTARRLE